MSDTVGFIGLGNMGGPMAANLVKAGFTVRGTDLDPGARDRASAAGVMITDDLAELVAGAKAVITMLPSGKHVLEVYPRLTEAVTPGTLLIDCSTISVEDARSAAELAQAAGDRTVDAPVSGGVVGADAGTLTFMAGGTDADVEAAKPLFDAMGARVVHCGGSGAGQTAKLCNNLMLAISMVGVSEAFVLGERLGLDHQALFDVASTSSGQCWALNTNCPVPGPVPTSPANRDYQPGFATALMNKDLGLAVEAIEATGTASTIGRAVAEIYRDFSASDGSGQDFSGIIQSIRSHSVGGPTQI